MASVEAQGLDVDGFVAGYDLKNSLRKLRDANGNQLYVQDVDQSTLYAQPIEFCRNGAWDATKARAIAGNWKYSLIGLRIQVKQGTDDGYHGRWQAVVLGRKRHGCHQSHHAPRFPAGQGNGLCRPDPESHHDQQHGQIVSDEGGGISHELSHTR